MWKIHWEKLICIKLILLDYIQYMEKMKIKLSLFYDEYELNRMYCNLVSTPPYFILFLIWCVLFC